LADHGQRHAGEPFGIQGGTGQRAGDLGFLPFDQPTQITAAVGAGRGAPRQGGLGAGIARV